MFHDEEAPGSIHVVHQYVYADATTRLAATGFVAADIGKVARQIDTASYWVLQNHSPITWGEMTSCGGGSVPLHATTHKHGGTDEVATATPAANAIPKADGTSKLDTWVSDASETVKGKVELATSAETTAGLAVQASDTRLSDARTPIAHATSHKHGGTDEVATATPAANAIPKAGADSKIDSGWIPAGAGNIYDRGFPLIGGSGTPYVQVKTNNVYVAMAEFIFRGTTNMSYPPNKAVVLASRFSTGVTVSVRLYDVTNATVIAEATGLTPSAVPSSPSIMDIGTVSNLPSNQAVFEVQLASSSNAAYANLHYFHLYYA